jgi:hypothetical protein
MFPHSHPLLIACLFPFLVCTQQRLCQSNDRQRQQGIVQTGALKDIALHSRFPFLAQLFPFDAGVPPWMHGAQLFHPQLVPRRVAAPLPTIL